MLNKRWQKYLYLLAFIVIFFVGDRLIAGQLQQVVLKSQFRYSVLYRGGQHYNVVVLGNSRGVNSIYAPAAEKITGLRVFNLSYNRLSMDLSEALFRDYLERNSSPKLLIIEVSNIFSRKDAALIKDLKLYSQFSKRIAQMSESLQTALFCKISHLYSFNGDFFLRVLNYLNKSDQSWINEYQIKPEYLQWIIKSKPEHYEIVPEQIRALNRLITLATQNGISLHLILSPYLPVYQKKIVNLSAIIAELEKDPEHKLHIWDYSKAIQNVNYFADRLHLNKNGSLLFIEKLNQDGLFDVKK